MAEASALRDFLKRGGDEPEKKKRDRERIKHYHDRDSSVYGEADDKCQLHKRFMSTHTIQRKAEVNPLLAEALAEDKKKADAKRRQELAEATRTRKLMVCGDARGGLEKLFSMVDMQDKKVGPFDALLCVGAFLPEAGSNVSEESFLAYLQGEKQAPRACYFIDTGEVLLQAAPSGQTLGANLHFLGAYGVREICGLRVAFLSGCYDAAVYETEDADYVGAAFTRRAVNKLQKLVADDPTKRGIDVLLTAGWPAGIDGNIADDMQKPPEVPGNQDWHLACAQPLTELCLAIEPRYHIFGSANIFYQRPPFQTARQGHACRCIGLGQVGSPLSKQQKWIHALALSPMAHMNPGDLKKLAPGNTASPFTSDAKQGQAEPQVADAAAAVDNTQILDDAMSALQGGDMQQYWNAAEKLRKSHFVYRAHCEASASSSSAQ